MKWQHASQWSTTGLLLSVPTYAVEPIQHTGEPTAKKYIVKLTDAERTGLLELIKNGQASARKLIRPHILLLADEGARDEAIALALHTVRAMVGRTRKRVVAGNLQRALREQPRPGTLELECQAGALLDRNGLRHATRRSHALDDPAPSRQIG